MVKGTGIESDIQDVRHIIDTHRGTMQHMLYEEVHLIIHARAGLELAEAAVARELVIERLLRRGGDKVVEVAYRFIDRRPGNAPDTLAQRAFLLILLGPLRIISIVSGATPLTALVIDPESAVCRMAGTEHCCVPIRRYGIDEASALGANLEFVAQGGYSEVLRRSGLLGLPSGMGLIIDTEDWLQ